MPEPTVIDRTFREYAAALLRHHRLQSSGKEDGPEAEAVEARMSLLWERLSGEQRQHLRGISSDLNWLRRGFQPPPKGRKKEEVTAQEREEFRRLSEAQDPLPLLHALRLCAPVLEAGFLSFRRAACYFELGLGDVSEPFLAAAIDLSPNGSVAGRAAFHMLIQVNPAGAFDKANDVVGAPEKYPPVVVATAVTFVLEFLGVTPSVDRDRLADILIRAGQRLGDEPSPVEDRVHFCSMAGAGLVALGRAEDAVGFLERGLESEPQNAELLGWMGEALYEKERPRAVGYLERSVASGTRLVRPHLHLAHHHLTAHDFERAKRHAAQAAELARDDHALALALEILAISMSETGAGRDVVLALLKRAVGLAPADLRMATNLAGFEKQIREKASHAEWKTAEEPLAGVREKSRTEPRALSPV